MAVLTKPQIAIPTEVEAIAVANRWLHREIGMALHTTPPLSMPSLFIGTCRWSWPIPIRERLESSAIFIYML